MYGPVNTTLFPYDDGVSESNFFAYSSGTGADTGSESVWITTADSGCVSLKTIVWSSGVWMPLMSGATVGSFLTAAWASLKPSSAPRYTEVYPFATPGKMLRSIAYLTSLDVTSRFTGGLNLIPLCRWKVIVLSSDDTSGAPSARSGDGWVSAGCQPIKPRWTASSIW